MSPTFEPSKQRYQIIPKSKWGSYPRLKFIISLKRDALDPNKWNICSYPRERLLIKFRKVPASSETQQKKRTFSEAFSEAFEDFLAKKGTSNGHSMDHDLIPTSSASIHDGFEEEPLSGIKLPNSAHSIPSTA